MNHSDKSENVAFESMLSAIDNHIATTGDQSDDVLTMRTIFHKTHEFLSNEGLYQESSASLEQMGRSVKINSNNAAFFENANAPAGVMGFLDEVLPKDLSKSKRASVAKEVLRVLDGQITADTHFFSNREAGSTKELMATHQLTSTAALESFKSDAAAAAEAFGSNIDDIIPDARTVIAVVISRAYKGLMDRMFARIPEMGNLILVRVPQIEVTDLTTSSNASAAVRNATSNRHPLVELYTNPTPVSTAPKRVVPDSNNDDDSVMVDESIGINQDANLFDLSVQANTVGYDVTDHTDMISEGGCVETIYVQITEEGSPDVVEVFPITVKHLSGAKFVPLPNNSDTGDRISVIRYEANGILTAGSLKSNGVASTILVDEAGHYYNMTIEVTTKLNLITGNIKMSGTVVGGLKAADGSAPAGAHATLDGILSVALVSFDPELYYSEENLRKSTTLATLRTRSVAFEIPVGRTILLDTAMDQKDQTPVIETIATLNAIGNSARGIAVIEGHLSDVAARNTHETNYSVPYAESVAMSYAGGSTSLPRVISGAIDFADEELDTLRSSEKVSDIHALLRAKLLEMTARVFADSHWLMNLEPGETPVLKVWTHGTLVDTLFGIEDYHNTLLDKPEGGRKSAGADWSMMLQNGVRVDVYRTNFASQKGKISGVLVREAAPEDITSAATIRDRGTFVGNYTNTGNNAAHRRMVVNSREIPFVTTPVGVLLTVSGLGDHYPQVPLS